MLSIKYKILSIRLRHENLFFIMVMNFLQVDFVIFNKLLSLNIQMHYLYMISVNFLHKKQIELLFIRIFFIQYITQIMYTIHDLFSFSQFPNKPIHIVLSSFFQSSHILAIIFQRKQRFYILLLIVSQHAKSMG